MLIDDLAIWAKTVVGSSVEVIIEPFDSDKPTGDYISINQLDGIDSGYPVRTVTAGTGEDLGTADVDEELFKEIAFDFNAYSHEGEALLDDLVCAAYGPESSICIVDQGNTRPLGFLEDSGHSPRFQRTMVFGTSHERSVTVQAAETMNMTGDFAGQDFTVGSEPAPDPPEESEGEE
jgi:hypothetical protein